jgi:hypothetical protein
LKGIDIMATLNELTALYDTLYYKKTQAEFISNEMDEILSAAAPCSPFKCDRCRFKTECDIENRMVYLETEYSQLMQDIRNAIRKL